MIIYPSQTPRGNGAKQYQTIVTGASPFAPVYSGFLLDGTAGGKTNLAVTSGKTLTLTATDNYNLTVPASGTAALLGTANVFTALQTITNPSNGDLQNMTGTETRIDAVHRGVYGYYKIIPTADNLSYSYFGQSFSTSTWSNTKHLAEVIGRYNYVGITGTGIIDNVQGGTDAMECIAPVGSVKGNVSSVHVYSPNSGFAYGSQIDVEQLNGAFGGWTGLSSAVKVLRIRLSNSAWANLPDNSVMGDAIGVYLSVENTNQTGGAATGTASITRLAGFQYDLTNGATGTITDSYGLLISAPANSGLITNHYGIYLGDQNVGSSLSYAIYTNAGAIRFGGATMGFYAHAPAAQPTKAGHNNWAAVSDVVAALVSIGIFDTA